MKHINKNWLFLMGVIAIVIASCTKDFNPDFELPRQFKPGDISIQAGETEAKLQWAPSLFSVGKNVTYTVQISQDSTFQGTIDHTVVVDSSTVTITDSVLQINQFYFARVKANEVGSTAESGWVYSSRFRITGEQIFFAVQDVDLKDTSVLLKWRPSTGLTSIKLTTAAGTTTTYNLTPADIAANQKLITGLTPATNYTAEIFRNNLVKGKISFRTKDKNIFSVILTPADSIVVAIANAADGDIIGLQPGTYDAVNSTGAYVNIIVQQKTITLQSVSNNPANTKVNFKEFNIKGSGAGLILKGIEFNGTAGSAAYFINFTGLTSDAEAANFTKLIVDNSIVKGTENSLIRGNRGGNNAHKIDTILLRNSIFADNGSSAGFDYILLDKMEFKALELKNSTFYNSGRRLISWATNITAPKPTVTLDRVTVNSIGYGGRDNVLIDANANDIDFLMVNSIFANTPKPGQTLGNNLLRASNAGASVVISHSNLFNLSNGAPTPAPLNIPSYVVLQNVINVDLGWTGTTTNFTLPAGSPVQTASTTNGPIGDPRWY